ncbi:hypothetical protein F0P96_18505 [Hymenobacter busanensis]|uniref:Uncharacterized protein n=1 Tax=Hymenobacter busanensis TaxID=2607656 RepID=A0A7L4ZS78_9BACT|nr:PD-(D/E)XK nuclease family protein [Hymenobacter busanensis]KAA9327225.1 hypothetical protein F0P96_18505 [Hymenobacter busanensis]QHJ05891.1 hypothetical protein GUY19_00710 [Hymenobacter busanensis]
MNTKPNLFSLATKELSQDAFFTWLLQWADQSAASFDQQLHQVAKAFVQLLLGESSDYIVNQVQAGRQWKNIDVWAEVNGEYFIAIEDKTTTGEHSEQLEKYKRAAEEHYKETGFKLVFIYLKTGNESLTTLKKITDKGYTVIGRKAILGVLQAKGVNNEIFVDFVEYLATIENQTQTYSTIQNIISDWRAAEGFYLQLQEQLGKWSDWGYVSNPTGGFLGFWYNWAETNDYSLYIQIENRFDSGIKVVVKIGDWEPTIDTLYRIVAELQPYAVKHELTLVKPDKYRTGDTSTLAVVKNAFADGGDGNFDLAGFVQVLKRLELVLNEYVADAERVLSSAEVNDPS